MLAAAIVRTGLALGTIVFAVIGTVRRGDVGWYAASGLMGTMWWLWDFFVEWLFAPIGAALARLFLEGGDMPPKRDPEDTAQWLEARLEQTVTRQSDIQAALRLADLYRVMHDDPVRARAVVEMMKTRYPRDADLARYDETKQEGRSS